MAECSDRPMFLPDVLVAQTTTFTVEVNGTPTTFTIGKGSWFANALVFWLMICDISGGKINYLFAEEGNNVVISPAGGSYEIQLLGDDDGTAVLLEQTGNMFNANDASIPFSFYSYLPLVEYNRGVEGLDGATQRTQDGRSYSVSGITQDIRKLKLALDRRLDYTDTTRWLNLWRNYWRKGRSVSCYPIWNGMGDSFLSRTGIWGDTGAGRFENLVIPFDSQTFWKASRLVNIKETIDIEEDSNKFYVRKSVPMSDPQPQILRLVGFEVS